VQAEGWRAEVGDLNISAFSLLYLLRFAIYPQCLTFIDLLSKKLDGATHCVYSYRFQDAPVLFMPVEECNRITLSNVLFPAGSPSYPPV